MTTTSENILQSFQRGDTRWQALRARCLSDLYFFNDVILGMGPLVPMKPDVHALMCAFATRATGHPLLDSRKYRLVNVPREVGKTTIITQGMAIQYVCANPNISIMLANEKEQTAKDMLSAIKWQFENNELLRALFPELIPADLNETTWSAARITVNRTSGRKEPTIFVIGVGGTVTGMHPDLILVDDAISREAMENARSGSWQIMHQVNRWINQLDPLVNKNAEPFPQIFFIGTMWYYGDCYEYIENAFSGGEEPKYVLLRVKLPDGTIQTLPRESVYVRGDLAVFRRSAIEDGRSIFPEKWTLEDLAKLRMRDPGLFASNMMNRPSDDVTATFKADWLKPLHWLDEHQFYITDENATKKILRLQDLDLLILVDPGGFGERLVESRARAAIVVVGDDFQGHKFFLDCYSEPDTYLAAMRRLVDWVGKYRPRKVYIERAGQQAAFAQLVREELKKINDPVVVDDVTLKPESRAKELRILEMEPFWQRGQVYVGTGANFHEFRTQYAQFPQARRVDILDILGYWPRVMKTTRGAPQNVAARQQAERNAYLAKRNWRIA